MKSQRHSPFPRGFTLLEVLAAVSILAVSLVALYQSFASAIFMLSSTNNLWLAIKQSQNELLRWERMVNTSVAVQEGKFEEKHPLYGFLWQREVTDISALGVPLRKVVYRILWKEGENDYSYQAQIYIKQK